MASLIYPMGTSLGVLPDGTIGFMEAYNSIASRIEWQMMTRAPMHCHPFGTRPKRTAWDVILNDVDF